ncbi:unnamed protein product, partial [Polarella glacialis]
VAIVRLCADEAFKLLGSADQRPHVISLLPEDDPEPGEALAIAGYCQGRDLRTFLAISKEPDTGPRDGLLTFSVQGAAMPEKGVSGAPVVVCSTGKTVAVHMGVHRGCENGTDCRATLLSAVRTAAGEQLAELLWRPSPPPPCLQVTGRRGTNDIINGVYEMLEDVPSGEPRQHFCRPVWVRRCEIPTRPPGGAPVDQGQAARSLFLYGGAAAGVWAIGTRLGDGALRSEGGLGGVVARRGGYASSSGNDPSEVCVGQELHSWQVAGGRAARLEEDPNVELRPLSRSDFQAQVLRWSHSANRAEDRLRTAPAKVDVTGFPSALAVLNGKMEKRPCAWNNYPAWQRVPVGDASPSQPVVLYRDAADSKWVLGFELGDGLARLAHVYTSLESPAEGFVWEIDCGDRWRPYCPATVRAVVMPTRVERPEAMMLPASCADRIAVQQHYIRPFWVCLFALTRCLREHPPKALKMPPETICLKLALWLKWPKMRMAFSNRLKRHFQASATSAIARFHRRGGTLWIGIGKSYCEVCAPSVEGFDASFCFITCNTWIHQLFTHQQAECAVRFGWCYLVLVWYLPTVPGQSVAQFLSGLQTRQFAEAAAAPKLSQDAAKALGSIKEGMKNKQAAQVQLSKAAKRTFPGNIRRYKLMGGRPEFHNVERNRNGRIFEPWHTFEIVISSSKNNCWITVKNKGWKYRTVIASHAGNVGFRAATKKSEAATYAIALNIGRKLKRLGISCAEVTFRKIMKVEVCLQAFQSVGLQVTRLTHQPRLPHGDPTKPRKQRRV